MGSLKTRAFRLANIILLLNANSKAFKSKSFLILPNLGYGDLIVCLPMFREMARRGRTIQVFSLAHAIPLLTQMCEGDDIRFLAVEDFLSDEEFGAELMIHRARKFGKRQGQPVLFIGQDLCWLHLRIRPDLDIGSVFYRLGRIPLSAQKEFKINDELRRNNPQLLQQGKPYVLIDHFPGTAREINKEIFVDIRERGFEVVTNPRDVKYENLVDLIENASELHLVNSSLLCFALTLKPKAKEKIVYRVNSFFYPGLHFYDDSWQERLLHSAQGERYELPVEVNRDSEQEILIQLSRRWRFRVIDFVFFRKYKEML
jgi:hypothetical protein